MVENTNQNLFSNKLSPKIKNLSGNKEKMINSKIFIVQNKKFLSKWQNLAEKRKHRNFVPSLEIFKISIDLNT